MASEIIVNTIKAPTTGANANKVIIPSGVTLDASAATVDASNGLTPPSGMAVQAVSHTWNAVTQLTIQTFTWTRYTATETSITAKYPNSRYVVYMTFPVASRATSANSQDIYYKVGSGSFAPLVKNIGGSSVDYGLSTIWDSGSTDIWASPSMHASNTVTSNAGDTITFAAYIRSGGPGTDNTSGNTQAGHPYYTGMVTVMEFKQ